MNPVPFSSVIDLYLQLVPTIDVAPSHPKRPRHPCIFSLAVVIYLMIFQRLQGRRTLAAAVQQLIGGLPPELNPRPCKRQRECRISSNTGGYNKARQKLSLETVQMVSDQIFDRLIPHQTGPQLFLLDGTTLSMPSTPSLIAAYPPQSQSKWPIALAYPSLTGGP